MIEVIAQNLEDALAIEEAGADRIELVSALELGGLTPSYGVIKSVLEHVRIPVNVMVRPTNRSFIMTEDEVESMCEDIKIIKDLGANGIVIGPITATGVIHRAHLEKMIQVSGDLEITFHRAFEKLNNPVDTFEILKGYPQIKSILTNGGDKSPIENLEKLKWWIKQASPIRILVGGGVMPEFSEELHKRLKNCDFHIGTGVRVDRSEHKAVDVLELKKMIGTLEKTI